MNHRNGMRPTAKRPASSMPGAALRAAVRLDEFIALALVLVAFAPTIPELVGEWIDRPEFSHGFLMPLVAGWVLWERRSTLRSLPRRDSVLGWGIVAVSMAFLLLGEMKLTFYLKPVAFVLSLFGLVWAFRGWQGVRAFAPAFIPLCLMCPLPGRSSADR